MSGFDREQLETLLGADHGLRDDQVAELVRTANEIFARYPGAKGDVKREAALRVAYRLMVGDPEQVVAELAAERADARNAAVRATTGLEQAARTLIRAGGRGIQSQQGFATRAGVAKNTVVERWLPTSMPSTSEPRVRRGATSTTTSRAGHTGDQS